MFSKEYDNFMVGVQHALNLPIRTRCAELTVLIDRASIAELHNFYPLLIDNIFGPQGTICWNLRTTTDANGEDFRQLQHFLSPCGPLFRLIYMLLRDPNMKFDFPLLYLPKNFKEFLETSTTRAFYFELINTTSQTKQLTSLLLNPFDYYFFHFAYHLVNPWQQRVGSNVTSWNTVYYSLCCDYILHFLPTEPEAKILPEIYYNGKNPLKRSSPVNSSQSSPRNQPTFGNAADYNIKLLNDKGLLNIHNNHPRNDIWRSETVLTVFTDIWLHNDLINQSMSTREMNDSFNNTPMRFHYNELPTGEYMRIVRVLIKQLHSFSDSAKCDDTHLCELKQMSITMIQGKFYIFLRNLIHKWPLDGSFRLVLELWLTYIQPWRYPANNLIKQRVVQQHNPDTDDISLGVEKQALHPTPQYLPFIAQNLLAYVVILQKLLPRFGRVDLVSPKISLMLYRVTKVFDQPGLVELLRDLDKLVIQGGHQNAHVPFPMVDNNLTNITNMYSSNSYNPSLCKDALNRNSNPGAAVDSKLAFLARLKIMEMEGSQFEYCPLFPSTPSQDVIDLLLQIRRSIGQAEEIIVKKEKEEKELYSGFWGSIKYFLQSPVSTDEFSLDERRKVPIYLDVSYNNLIDIFRINQEILEENRNATANLSTNEFDTSNDYSFLTPEKVRSRLKSIRYDGDPDLLPIRSYECAFLVRLFYQCATKINESFGPNFYQLYHNPSYWGRFTRQILMPPQTVYKYDKTLIGSPRVSIHLQPRISFRYFASYRFLFYLLISVLITWLLNYRFDLLIFSMLCLFVFYNMLKAIPKDGSKIRHEYPTQGFGNISFNDSF